MALPKYLGVDGEFSTTGVDGRGQALSAWDVTRQVLCYIDAGFRPTGHLPWWIASGAASAASSDCLRQWPPNGQCYYADMGHVEACSAETLSPLSHAAQAWTSLRVVEAGRRMAEGVAPAGTRYTTTAHIVDAQDPATSWGHHVNVSVATELFNDLFIEHRHPTRLGMVSSALAAAVPFFGSGYLLPMRDGSTVYSLSGRAHHLGMLISHATTEPFRRGILNSRREPHGDAGDRLHLIGFDASPVAAALRASFLQCLLAAAEEGYCGLNLYDPVQALRIWSWGLDLHTGKSPARAMLVDGRQLTLPQYLRELCTVLLHMVESGLIGADVAPQAGTLLPIILDLTHRLERGELAACARHLDWAAKLMLLLGLCQQTGARLGDPVTRLADQDFGNTNPDVGGMWRLWREGLVDPLVDEAQVEQFLVDGPPESRAWARGRLIQRFADDIEGIDWSWIELRRAGSSRWGRRLRVEMPRLDSWNRRQFEPIIAQARDVEHLERLLRRAERLEFRDSDPVMEIMAQLATGPVHMLPYDANGHQP